ncbi:MAG: PhoH family protein [Candidatus Riflebacteria bacterium]|nr:PhoH family protein [Candidatus Riflebacteria bacterium]
MSENEELIDLSDDVSRHVLAAGNGGWSGLELIKGLSGIRVRARGNQLILTGLDDRVDLVKRFLRILQRRLDTGEQIGKDELKRMFEESTECGTKPETSVSVREKPYDELLTTHSGHVVRAKTANQQAYIDAIRHHDVTISIGPAGTGKTYLAIAMAVHALRERHVSRIILSRPTIEAGEKLGFLPGDLMEKVDPHFRPLYDALQEFLGVSRFQQLLRQGIIEITPLAYMRGRTFNEAFIVLDEAQNTTIKQMRMFLTRMGHGSKVIVTGDRTQVDLPDSRDSSLFTLPEVLNKVEGVSFIQLRDRDVIRHELVKEIIRAYESYYHENDESPQ